MTVSFETPEGAANHIDTIVDRIWKLARKSYGSKLDIRMDIAATHANGCPLDFERLAQADDFNLIHDVLGIARHLDRESGRLTGHFRPRFALPAGPSERADR